MNKNIKTILLLILLFVIYSCTTNTVKKESLSGISQKDSISTKYDDSIVVRSHVDKTIGKELSLWMHNKSNKPIRLKKEYQIQVLEDSSWLTLVKAHLDAEPSIHPKDTLTVKFDLKIPEVSRNLLKEKIGRWTYSHKETYRIINIISVDNPKDTLPIKTLFNTGNLNFVYGGKKHGVIITELH
ncbi:MAG: hypothetical protein KHX29_01555 [Prevotella buccalis]|nr:hypothetical protein [Hoylesella buccalis]